MVREFLALPLNTAKASVRHFGWSLPQQQVPVPGRDGSIRCSLLLAVRQLNSQRHCRKGAVCKSLVFRAQSTGMVTSRHKRDRQRSYCWLLALSSRNKLEHLRDKQGEKDKYRKVGGSGGSNKEQTESQHSHHCLHMT